KATQTSRRSVQKAAHRAGSITLLYKTSGFLGFLKCSLFLVQWQRPQSSSFRQRTQRAYTQSPAESKNEDLGKRSVHNSQALKYAGTRIVRRRCLFSEARLSSSRYRGLPYHSRSHPPNSCQSSRGVSEGRGQCMGEPEEEGHRAGRQAPNSIRLVEFCGRAMSPSRSRTNPKLEPR
ncbi:hypothetical protein PTI98_009071, partial [Pleurotus ostreatus]